MKSAHLFTSTFFAFCFLHFIAAPASALPSVGEATPSVVVEEKVVATEPSSIHALEQQALALSRTGEFPEVEQVSLEFLEAMRLQGVVNAPGLSFQFIDRAVLYAEQGDLLQAKNFHRLALTLSPDDPVVSYLLARVPGVLSWQQRFEFLLSAAGHLRNSPRLIMSIMAHVGLTTLFGVTLVLLLVCIVQVVSKSGIIFARPSFSVSSFAKVILLVMILVLPLSAGLLPGLLGAAIVASASVYCCRWLCALSGAVILLWGVSLPVVENVLLNTRATQSQFLEAVNSKSIVDVTWQPENAAELEVVFASGLLAARSSKMNEAEGNFNTVAQQSSNAALKVAAMTNLGAARVLLGDGKGAVRALLEADKLSPKSFAIKYNLAQSSLKLLDTEAHRNYYHQAGIIDSERLELEQRRIQESGGSGGAVVFEDLPQGVLFSRLFRLPEQNGVFVDAPQLEEVRGAVLRTLLLGGREMHCIILGALGIFVGLMLRLRARELGEEASVVSRAWHVLPGGLFVAGKWPLYGLLISSTILVLFLHAISFPVQFFGIVARGANLADPLGRGLMVAGFAIYVLSALISEWAVEMSRRGAA